jgi:hypothetical protein
MVALRIVSSESLGSPASSPLEIAGRFYRAVSALEFGVTQGKTAPVAAVCNFVLLFAWLRLVLQGYLWPAAPTRRPLSCPLCDAAQPNKGTGEAGAGRSRSYQIAP